MDEMSFIEKLMVFGLTRQEASIYLCLYRNGILTGYEAAKLTGISRSNVYKDRKSTRLNSSHRSLSRMPSSA